MTNPCDFSITSIHSIEDGEIVRVEAKDGPKVLVRIDVAPADFMKSLLEMNVVIAAITMAKP